jgi:RNA polymerase sigma-32 factor
MTNKGSKSPKANKPKGSKPKDLQKDVKIPRVLAPEVLPPEEEKDVEEEDPEKDDSDSESDLESDLESEGDEAAYQHQERSEPDSQLPVSTEHTESEEVRSKEKAVSSTDPLRRYLEEVRRYPLLEPQEEMRLAIKLRDTGDLQAAKSLVSANLRLVVKIALEYKNFYSNLLDLVQEGNIGLMKAVSKFDPTKGARLGYYASWWIRSYILKYLLDNFRLVKVGTTQAQKKLFYHLMREKERLEAQGLLAGPKLLAEKLNVREKDVIEMEQRLSGRGAEMSLDSPVERGGDGSGASHMDLLVDGQETVDESLARQQLLALLQKRLPEFRKLLNDRETKILQDRILSEEPQTLQEVADLYGLTRERARQIEVQVIKKLREFLASDFAVDIDE